MKSPSAIAVSYDGLGCGFLGPYGSTWAPTPVWNELAARACLYDFVFTPSPSLAAVAESWWTGRHPLAPSGTDGSLPAACVSAGVHSVCLTDDADLMSLGQSFDFAEQISLNTAAATSASSLEETNLFRQTLAACEHLAGAQPPFFAWIHLSALRGAWDAPYEMRLRLADEEDLAVPDFVTPPWHDVLDPDAMWAIQVAYAAQMMAVDASLGLLVDLVEQLRSGGDVALYVTSPRGYSIGGHGAAGVGLGSAWSDELHVPLLVDLAGGQPDADRINAIHDSSQVHDLVRRSLFAEAKENAASRARAVYTSDTHQALRTAAWFFRQPIDTDESAQLFVKPDDRWDVNEIGDRCPEIMDAMQAELSDFLKAAAANRLAELGELRDVLLP